MSSIVATNISSFAKISPVKGFVFKGKRNLLTIAVNDFYPESMASLPRIWTDVDRMVLHVCSFNAETGTATEIVATADTDVDATLINYSAAGQVVLKLGALTTLLGAAIPDAEYLVRLTSYVGELATQVLHESQQVARIVFVDTETV